MICTHNRYQDIRKHIKPGDIIAFNGRGRFSRIVQLATGAPVSHIGIVCISLVQYYGHNTVEIMESVREGEDPETGEPITGVTRNRLSTRIANYDGRVWWLPLSDQSRATLDYTSAVRFLMSVMGRPYDLPQAILSAIDALDDFADKLTYAVEDYSALFCSELAAAALKAGGVLPQSCNPSEVTPIDLCRMPIYFPAYSQLKGAPRDIPGFNSGASCAPVDAG